jgi:hypothetical protein
MMSSTSITSTIGVTLMSEVTLAASFRFANAIEFCLLRPTAWGRILRHDQPKLAE